MSVIRLANGEPARYTSIGCYTICYHFEGWSLCPKCAAEAEDEGDDVTPFINWEDDWMNCADCGRELEASYPNKP